MCAMSKKVLVIRDETHCAISSRSHMKKPVCVSKRAFSVKWIPCGFCKIPPARARVFYNIKPPPTVFVRRLFFIFNILHHIFNIAFKNFTKGFYRVCAYTFVPLQTSDLPRTYVILGYQLILCNPFFAHCFPKIFI